MIFQIVALLAALSVGLAGGWAFAHYSTLPPLLVKLREQSEEFDRLIEESKGLLDGWRARA